MADKIVNFVVGEFEYTCILQYRLLKIKVKHIEECVEWSTIIVNKLLDYNEQNTFIIDLTHEDIYLIFENYVNNIHNVKITFPNSFTDVHDDLYILMEFQRTYGKERITTKHISLTKNANEPIVVLSNKVNLIKTNINNKIDTLCNTVNLEKEELHDKIKSLEESILMLQNDIKILKLQ